MSEKKAEFPKVEWTSTTGLPVTGPFFEGEITPEILSRLYPLLQFPLPDVAIQRAYKEQTRKGYDTTGFGYQFLVNRMNEVLGPAYWRPIFNLLKETQGQFGNPPKPNNTIVVETTIEIGNWKDGEFIPICRFYGVGSQTGLDWGDTLKGAQSNSLKKALGFIGVGREAYEGTIDDDNKSDLEPNNNRQTPVSSLNNSPDTSKNSGVENKANSGNTEQKSPTSLPTVSIVTGQIILVSDPVQKTGKASVMGVFTNDELDVEVEVCGWASSGMLDEVMALRKGQVLEVQGVQMRSTEKFGVQISLKPGTYTIAA